MKSSTLTAALALGLSSSIHAAAQGKPNILLILSDDQSYETVRALGHTDIDTPNLDRLAGRGTTFTHAYNMGSWSPAVCVASRGMLITGRTLWRANAPANSAEALREAGRLWPQRMAAVGYETYFTGKWHIRTDAAQCFDHSVNIRGGIGRRGFPKDVHDRFLASKSHDSHRRRSLANFRRNSRLWHRCVRCHTCTGRKYRFALGMRRSYPILSRPENSILSPPTPCMGHAHATHCLSAC